MTTKKKKYDFKSVSTFVPKRQGKQKDQEFIEAITLALKDLKVGRSVFVENRLGSVAMLQEIIKENNLRTKDIYVSCHPQKSPIAGTWLYRKL